MASLMLKKVANIARITPRFAGILSIRAYSDEAPIEPHKGKAVADRSMPDPLGHSVGTERFELLANLHGDDDPFEIKKLTDVGGTKKDPVRVPSIFNERIIGCACEEDAMYIKYMELARGEPKRCLCGYWFQLVDLEHKDYGQ